MISVRPLHAAERSAAEALRVAPDQQGFVATNIESMRQADELAYCTRSVFMPGANWWALPCMRSIPMTAITGSIV